MNTKDLVSSRKIRSFTVDYYITFDSETVGEPGPCYGIAIEKTDGDESETFCAPRCFDGYGYAYAMVEKLSRFRVTPAGAEETIEVILECLCP